MMLAVVPRRCGRVRCNWSPAFAFRPLREKKPTNSLDRNENTSILGVWGWRDHGSPLLANSPPLFVRAFQPPFFFLLGASSASVTSHAPAISTPVCASDASRYPAAG